MKNEWLYVLVCAVVLWWLFTVRATVTIPQEEIRIRFPADPLEGRQSADVPLSLEEITNLPIEW